MDKVVDGPSFKRGEKLEILKPTNWYHRGHDFCGGYKNDDGIWTPKFQKGTFLWNLAPAVALATVEQLREARNKRMQSIHIVLVPRLFTSLWRRQSMRAGDVFCELPFIDGVWDKSQHKPLTLTILFPFLPYSPWQLRRSGTFLEMGRALQSLWKSSEFPSGILLRKLCTRIRDLETMPRGVVSKMLQSPSRFEIPR